MGNVSRDLAWLNRLLAKKHIKLDFAVAEDRSIDAERRAGKKHRYCTIQSEPSLIRYANALEKAPTSTRRGVLLHEVGHGILFSRGNGDHAEHEADDVIKEIFGIKIRYDKKGVQRL
jgi:hypothetical protein